MIIKELPKEERPREKILKYGVEYLSNVELLAIIIRTGTKEKSALGLAEEIIAKNENGIGFLTECTPEELSEVKGMGMAKSCQLISAIELGKRLSRREKDNKILADRPEIIAKLFMEEMRYYKKEVFNVLLVNSKSEIITIDKASIGDLSSALVHPREIFNKAVRRSAAAIVLVHNHPSGNPFPSEEDIETTKRLVEAGRILGINVLDHIIIGDGTYISLRKKHLMDN